MPRDEIQIEEEFCPICGADLLPGNNRIEDFYLKVLGLARINHQVVGRKNDYYITLEQLEMIIKGEK